MISKKTLFLTKAAVIAALYAALTYLSAAFGLAYGNIQFRISEILTVLPVFTGAAVPGLAVGCLVSNITSTVNPADMIFGTLATLAAAILTRALRKIQIKNLPFLSLLMPVIFNAVIVGAEIAIFSGEESRLAVFFSSVLSVGLGEAAVIFILGLPLCIFIRKHPQLENILSD